ncbi:hypothetical protein ACHAWX_002931 [Stephanocyclus meneghinianus]
MAFSFGTTPAPAAGGFSFGGTPAPSTAAPTGGFFGAPAPSTTTAAPSTSLFGAPSSSTSSGGLFGSTPAPSGGLFGAPAPAPSGGLFGSAPAPSGGLFGSTPAAAPPGGLFGSTAPAPSGGLFGFATSTPFATQQHQQQQEYTAPLSGSTPYSQLPNHLKNAIDDIYRHIMSHRRTIVAVKSMAPSLLTDSTANLGAQSNLQSAPADIAAGSPTKKTKNSNLSHQLQDLHRNIQEIAVQTKNNIDDSAKLKQAAGETVAMAKMHGLWPVEMVAARRNVILLSLRKKVDGGGVSSSSLAGSGQGGKSATISNMPEMDVLALQHIMDMRAASVDRKENIPSPYFWEVIHNLEKRAKGVTDGLHDVNLKLAGMEGAGRNGISASGMGDYHTNECTPSLVLFEEGQMSFPARCAKLARIQNDQFLHIASNTARVHEELELMKIRHRRMCEAQKGLGQYDDPFFKADVEEMRKERELQQRIIEERLSANAAPAPPAAAPASLVHEVHTPAPSGGLFGSTPAPSTATPATGGLFGASAPAPTGGGFFGNPASAAPAASGTTLFAAPTTPASTLAPRKKPGSRSGGRRR